MFSSRGDVWVERGVLMPCDTRLIVERWLNVSTRGSELETRDEVDTEALGLRLTTLGGLLDRLEGPRYGST